ncbi:pumilio protein 2 [Novymonas esmeraldas]|uniref:Pumilio protein 2 n=1 Tax=Novymonas esmeraldas TaxID=1808958 RepID=A0AAW0EV50_9TRYP
MTSNWAAASDARLRVEDIDWGSTDGEDIFSSPADDFMIADPRAVRRAETAPMVLTIMNTDGSLCVGGVAEEPVNPEDEYRYAEEYHRLYYSKNPRDPRMLPPLTRRRHHLVRTVRPPAVYTASSGGAAGVGVGSAQAAAPSSNGAVGDPMETTTPPLVAAGAGGAAAVAEAEGEAVSSQALVKLYVASFRPDWDYAQIRSHVCVFSRDQDGSRLVQRLLERPQNIVPIYKEVMVEFSELATDVFGNYVLQKMFDVVPKAENDPSASADIRAAGMLRGLTAMVRGRLLEFSGQTYGCRVMQKAVENVRPEDRDALIHELDDKVVDSVMDQNANHVVQKVIEVCPAASQFIIDAFLPALGDLACHAYGCRVLQRTFEKCHGVAEVNIRPLLQAVLDRVNEFTVHQYGNYVVQHAMLNSPDDLRHSFVVRLTPQLYALSCSKFASNVAERIVGTATEEERDAIIRELRKPLSDSQGGNYLVNMMQDTYANYVVQRFFEAVSAAQRELISELVQPYIGSINQSVYGRHLLRKMVSNNILSNAFLLGHGIDVSGPEYGGSTTHTSGHGNRNGGGGGGGGGGGAGGGRNGGGGGGGGGRNNANGGGHYSSSHNGGRGGRDHRSGGGGGGGRPGRGGRGAGGNNNNNNANGGGGGGHQQGGGVATNMLVFQSPQQSSPYPPSASPMTFASQAMLGAPQPPMSGYMPMPQQYAYGNPYGLPQQQQQQQPQQQPQPQQQQQQQQSYMQPVPAAQQFYPSPQAFMQQMGPSGYAAYPGAATAATFAPQQQLQAGNYTLQYGAPVQQSTPPSQQLQPPPRRGGAQSPQAYVNGGYNGVGQVRQPQQQQQQQQQSPGHSTGSLPAPLLQQQQLTKGGGYVDAAIAAGKADLPGVSNAGYGGVMGDEKVRGGGVNKSPASALPRAAHGNARSMQQASSPSQQMGY